MLLIYLWVWPSPQEHGQPTKGDTLKENRLPQKNQEPLLHADMLPGFILKQLKLRCFHEPCGPVKARTILCFVWQAPDTGTSLVSQGLWGRCREEIIRLALVRLPDLTGSGKLGPLPHVCMCTRYPLLSSYRISTCALFLCR